MDVPLLIESTSGDTTVLSLSSDLPEGGQLVLHEYRVEGAPTTGTVPDEKQYLVNFTGALSAPQNVTVAGRTVSGFPISLDGGTTVVRYTPPRLLVRNTAGGGGRNLELSVRKASDGSAATFTYLYLHLEYVGVHQPKGRGPSLAL